MDRLAYPLGGRLTASASLLADEEHGVNAQNAKEEPEPEPRAAQEHPVRAAPTACIALRSAPRCAESAALRRASQPGLAQEEGGDGAGARADRRGDQRALGGREVRPAARPPRSRRRSRQSGWSSATAARSHSAACRKWYTGTVSKYNTRSGTHTVDYDDVCAPPRLVLLCVAPEPCAVGQGESIVHDLSQTDYKLDDTDESGTVSALLPQVRRARPAPTAGPYSPKPHLLLEQDGDCVAIRWAGAPACLCILRKDKDGDLIPYPVDGSWEDPNLVFDAGKDDWEWPTDAAFQASSVAGAADDSDDAAPPAHDLNATLKVRGGEPRLGLRLTARKSNLSFRRRWFSWLLRWAWPVSWSMSRSAKSCGNSLVRRGPPR